MAVPIYRAERTPRRDADVVRPVVPVSVAGPAGASAPRVGLIDTMGEGAGRRRLADLAGVDPLELSRASVDICLIGIGGQPAKVTFAEVELRLYPPDVGDFVSRRCDVRFVPGRALHSRRSQGVGTFSFSPVANSAVRPSARRLPTRSTRDSAT